jgi:hypothetical protein
MELTDHINKIVESNYKLANKQDQYAQNLKSLMKSRKKVVKAYKSLAKAEKYYLSLEIKSAKLYSNLQDYKIELKTQGILNFQPDHIEFKKLYSDYHQKISEKRLEIAQIFEKLAILEEKLIESIKKLAKMKKEEAKILKKVAKKEKDCSKLTKQCVNPEDLSETKLEKLKNKIKKSETQLEDHESKLQNKRLEILEYEREISKIEENLAVLMKALSFKYGEGESIRPPD